MSIVTTVAVKVVDELLGETERQLQVELKSDHTWSEYVEPVVEAVEAAVDPPPAEDGGHVVEGAQST